MTANKAGSNEKEEAKLFARDLKDKELFLYRKLNEIQKTVSDKNDVMDRVLHYLVKTLDAEQAFVFSFDKSSEGLEMIAVTDRLRSIYAASGYKPLRKPCTLSLKKHSPIRVSGKITPYVRSIITVPAYTFGEGLPLAVFGAVNKMGAREFSLEDEKLLSAVVDQLQQPLQYSYLFGEVERRNKELRLVYKIDQLIDQVPDFTELLHRVIDEFVVTLSAEAGVIFLKKGKKLEVAAANDAARSRFQRSDYLLLREIAEDSIEKETKVSNYADLDKNQKHFDATEIRRSETRAALSAPIYSAEGTVMGAFVVSSKKNKRNFSAEDAKLFTAIASQADNAVFQEREKSKLRNAFKRYVSESVVNELLKDPESLGLGGKRQNVAVMFADLRGFTPLAEKMDPKELVGFLNEYFAVMTEIIFKYGGTIDKYIGDSIMALFGAPITRRGDCFRCVQAALEMQRELVKLNRKWARAGLEVQFKLGIGVNYGEMVVGNLGSPQYMNYTVIGDNVNLAARLESNAKPGQVLVSKAMYEQVSSDVAADKLAPLLVKGKSEPVQVYELKGIL
ncbi:hypothetical protein AUJ65_02835 [Candidatus Micrarchaeota archaeon CG1_02_51_15]|nr:MAG: hypothetical protein AUJ65_02835 [Candidatus Micrarchaeota archaeon CG1_02_51_15]